jgi:Tfp pilus assembly PilM family ATPase
MARILAVDWDTQEVRYLVAAQGGKSVKIEAAGAAPLVVTGGAGKPSKPDLGQSLQKALAGVKLGRATVVAGVDRAGAELLHLTLPPAKDAELPELVLHQAMRESQSVGEDSALDFLAAGANPAEPRKVTAAALSAEQVQQIMMACAAARLKPARLVLRPYAAASLFAQTAASEQRVCLLINLIGDEADLTLMVEKQVAFLRTVRLPAAAEEEKRTQRLLAEIQRTLAVALVGELEKEGLQGICIFGDRNEHESLIERIHAELGLTVTLLNPFDVAPTPPEFRLANPGRFAALLGMAMDERSGRAPAIDFLRPRRRLRPRSRRRNMVTAAAAVLVAAAAGGMLFWDKVSAATAENQQLESELHNLKGSLDKAREQQRLVEAIREWQSSDITWLD